MGPVSAQLLDELGYDPEVPDVRELGLIAVGAVVRARDGARPVAVARLGSGRLVVVDDRCPHDGGRISDGFVDGELLVCTRHGWELDVLRDATGGSRCERRRPCKLRE
ncbi:MAG: Rieske (2Fe-2S) iron-sulfur domain protein [Deltaproteobacteria bacterium]|nr:Rieske (2Fe-2S) iron-sulfur domain protein [Deltaproteobacteria bacterium]